MLYTVETDKELDQVCADLQEAVAHHRYGVLHVHNLKETMAKKGVDFSNECRIYEVCNPHQAKKVLEQRMEVSTALPCRISVYEEGGKVKLSTLRATLLLETFGLPALRDVAKQVEEDIAAMMDEAAAPT